ncbi:uncharacterized protein G2W53_010318 [Senna tora]|uniref:Uncharacterized protein n=1 Tax=Senna tora TaxID=362788 RepID=A0A834X012_9FABA|nr:uncharacterized protein G2W53_010318 [Senna tora]
MGGAWIMSQHIPDEKSRSDLRNLHELRGKRLVAQVSQHTSVRVVLANRSRFDAPIGVVSAWKHSRITRQKTRCASESNTSVRVVLANRSGFDAPIGVVLAWEERGSCLNIFRTTNRGVSAWEDRGSCLNIFRTTNRVGSQKPSRITRQKTRCASESSTSFLVVLANRSGLDAPIGVVSAWEERGSCLNIFWTTNRGRISETFMNYEAKGLLRKVLMLQLEVVLAWGGACIMSQHIPNDKSRSISETFTNYEAKTCCASESTHVVRVVLAEPEWFDAPIGVVLAWRSVDHVSHIREDKSRSDLKKPSLITRKKTVAQVSQPRWFACDLRTGVVLMLQLESSPHGRSVDHVSTYSGRQIAVGSQKPSRITRQKTCCASESNTSIRVVLANRSGLDAPIGVVLAWVERGSCLNIFQTTNQGRISDTLTNYEAKDLLRNVDHVSTYSGRQTAVGSQIPSRITRQKTCCTSESNKSVRIVLANRSGFDAPIGVVSAWEERGTCLNIFRTTNRGRISETFTNYEAKDLLRNRLRMGRAWIMSQHIPDDKSRSDLRNLHELRGKRLVAQVSQHTSVRAVLANRSGFDAPIGVVLAWDERGSFLNIFRMTNRGRISETFTNYEAKELLRK